MTPSLAVRSTSFVLGGAALLVGALDAPVLVRSVVVAAFLLAGPGAAVVGVPQGWSLLACVTAIVSLSLSVALVLSTALIYLTWWSATNVLLLMLLVCVVGTAFELRRTVSS